MEKMHTRERMVGARIRCWLTAAVLSVAVLLTVWLTDPLPDWLAIVLAVLAGMAVGAWQRVGYWSGRLAERDAHTAMVRAARISPWMDGS